MWGQCCHSNHAPCNEAECIGPLHCCVLHVYTQVSRLSWYAPPVAKGLCFHTQSAGKDLYKGMAGVTLAPPPPQAKRSKPAVPKIIAPLTSARNSHNHSMRSAAAVSRTETEMHYVHQCATGQILRAVKALAMLVYEFRIRHDGV